MEGEMRSESDVRILFVDFSLAFNTIMKLMDLDFLTPHMQLDRSFPMDQSQRVRVGPHTSFMLTLSTSGLCAEPLPVHVGYTGLHYHL